MPKNPRTGVQEHYRSPKGIQRQYRVTLKDGRTFIVWATSQADARREAVLTRGEVSKVDLPTDTNTLADMHMRNQIRKRTHGE